MPKSTLDEVGVISAYVGGKSLSEVGKMFSASETAVRKILVKHSVPRRQRGGNNGRKTTFDVERAVALYVVEGMNVAELSRVLGVDPKRVRKAFDARGVKRRRLQAPLQQDVAFKAAELRLKRRLPWAAIVAQLGVNRGTLQTAVKRLIAQGIIAAGDGRRFVGGETKPVNKLHLDEAWLLSLHHQGWSTSRIGPALGCTGATVANRLKELGVPRRKVAESLLLTRQTRDTLLNDQKVYEMRVIATCCRNWVKLGKMFQVWPTTARRAVLGLSWTHVPMPERFQVAA